MDNKRFKMFFAITLIVVILACASFYIFKQISSNNAIIEEYVPQQEISDEQVRRTIVKLYFKEIGADNLKYENRSIDSKELLSNPYLTLVNLLIAGPSDDGLENIIPVGTVANSASLNGNTAVIDLSSTFVASVSDVNVASNMIYSIVNTLTELTEVNTVKFLIDGKETNFANCDFSLKEPFARK